MGFPGLEFPAEAVEGEHGAHLRVARAAVTDEFSFDGILLVSERERGGCEPPHLVRVMQRCRDSRVDFLADGEVDVAEAEGLRAGGSTVGVLGRAEEEEESDNDEVDDDLVVHSVPVVGCVEDVGQDLDEGGVGGVGSLFRVIFVLEALEERSEYGYVLVGVRFEAGIRLTQVGDARAHGQ